MPALVLFSFNLAILGARSMKFFVCTINKKILTPCILLWFFLISFFGYIFEKEIFSSRWLWNDIFRCGSYDHILYALDYKNYQCVYDVACGGSIFGSPAIDEVNTKSFLFLLVYHLQISGIWYPFCLINTMVSKL